MKHHYITAALVAPAMMFVASCSEHESVDSVESESNTLSSNIDDEQRAIKMIESLPDVFDQLAKEKISLDDVFNMVDPSICGDKADYVCRFVSSNARYSVRQKSIDQDLIVSADCVLAKYIYEHYPLSRQFFEDYDGVSKLNIENLVDAWRHIPEPE